jgi:hypothetical protein
MAAVLRARMNLNKGDTAAAARIALCAVRDSADVFPPLKAVVAMVITVWDSSRVGVFCFCPFYLH